MTYNGLNCIVETKVTLLSGITIALLVVERCIDGTIKLSGSSVDHAGMVIICINGTWGRVCGGEMDTHFAAITCAQLGYSPNGSLLMI